MAMWVQGNFLQAAAAQARRRPSPHRRAAAGRRRRQLQAAAAGGRSCIFLYARKGFAWKMGGEFFGATRARSLFLMLPDLYVIRGPA